jgi:hypothetical protein
VNNNAVATWNLGNHFSMGLKTEENQENLCRFGRSQDAYRLLASSQANKTLKSLNFTLKCVFKYGFQISSNQFLTNDFVPHSKHCQFSI